jgi:hypothetical protein
MMIYILRRRRTLLVRGAVVGNLEDAHVGTDVVEMV